jgi:hypothetical protein
MSIFKYTIQSGSFSCVDTKRDGIEGWLRGKEQLDAQDGTARFYGIVGGSIRFSRMGCLRT